MSAVVLVLKGLRFCKLDCIVPTKSRAVKVMGVGDWASRELFKERT